MWVKSGGSAGSPCIAIAWASSARTPLCRQADCEGEGALQRRTQAPMMRLDKALEQALEHEHS